MSAALLAFSLLAVGCTTTGRGPPGPTQPAAAELRTLPLPTALWTDEPLRETSEGHAVWVDPARGRTIHALWATPRDQTALGLVLFFPALGQASTTADPLVRMLAGAGYAVVVLSEPRPVDLRPVGSAERTEQRQPPFGTPEVGPGAGSAPRSDDPAATGRPAPVSRDRSAARAAFSIPVATERALDAHFALSQLEKTPPFSVTAEARGRVAIVGLELGAQTAQLLIGEQMQRQIAAAPDSRVRAAVLLAPFSSFEGPAFSQRYRAITVPLLVVFGNLESDSHGLGITAAQRRQMAKAIEAPLYAVELSGASVTELFVRRGAAASGDSARARAPMIDTQSGGPGGRPGPTQTTLADEVAKGPRFVNPELAPAPSRTAPAALRTTLLATRAFLDAVLLGDADAREWLERNSGGSGAQARRSN